ncbi:Retrovirus-related Pol polyprotein from type-2 retrotransposable element R2DM-like Protein [Tribolium castaneum]|uniref:Retrovirus-related Pol polyprotein from type-2 retrotransposable element R2DM-like Protein n=1 Tax=Tribolium castaneum TaxID=7070 RepID=A0A139WNH0_TRICA|nr:Retrovirus-related Pol polyprotein from type-2 retrotransposable element R2DM-like Protein [Tribolium castaneum]
MGKVKGIQVRASRFTLNLMIVFIKRLQILCDPLFPLVFNLVLDRALKRLSTDVGFRLTDATKVTALVFADHLVLCTTTARGLQTNLDVPKVEHRLAGFLLNPNKCGPKHDSPSGCIQYLEVPGNPLKPQQRMHLLRVFFLPKFYHAWTFERLNAGVLRRMDVVNRTSVRTWLRLLHDIPVGYFYAPTKFGGLGIPHCGSQEPMVS